MGLHTIYPWVLKKTTTVIEVLLSVVGLGFFKVTFKEVSHSWKKAN